MEGVRALRDKLEPAGCKVVSTLLLRDPVDQLASEWCGLLATSSVLPTATTVSRPLARADRRRVYFHSEPDKNGTASPLAWASSAPDNLLRWLLRRQPSLWGDCYRDEAARRATPSAVPPGCGLRDCGEALSEVRRALDEIDVVGTADTVETYAQWWLGVGRRAGFDALALLPGGHPPQHAKRASASNPSNRLSVAAELNATQREVVRSYNRCAHQAYRIAEERRRADLDSGNASSGNTTTPTAWVTARSVATLVSAWGGVLPWAEEAEAEEAAAEEEATVPDLPPSSTHDALLVRQF